MSTKERKQAQEEFNQRQQGKGGWWDMLRGMAGGGQGGSGLTGTAGVPDEPAGIPPVRGGRGAPPPPAAGVNQPTPGPSWVDTVKNWWDNFNDAPMAGYPPVAGFPTPESYERPQAQAGQAPTGGAGYSSPAPRVFEPPWQYSMPGAYGGGGSGGSGAYSPQVAPSGGGGGGYGGSDIPSGQPNDSYYRQNQLDWIQQNAPWRFNWEEGPMVKRGDPYEVFPYWRHGGPNWVYSAGGRGSSSRGGGGSYRPQGLYKGRYGDFNRSKASAYAPKPIGRGKIGPAAWKKINEINAKQEPIRTETRFGDPVTYYDYHAGPPQPAPTDPVAYKGPPQTAWADLVNWRI